MFLFIISKNIEIVRYFIFLTFFRKSNIFQYQSFWYSLYVWELAIFMRKWSNLVWGNLRIQKHIFILQLPWIMITSCCWIMAMLCRSLCNKTYFEQNTYIQVFKVFHLLVISCLWMYFLPWSNIILSSNIPRFDDPQNIFDQWNLNFFINRARKDLIYTRTYLMVIV